MNFLDALDQTTKGKKIRRKGFAEGYITFLDNKYVNDVGDVYGFYIEDINATDWEIYEEPKKTKMVTKWLWAFTNGHTKNDYIYSDFFLTEEQAALHNYKMIKLSWSATEFEVEE